MLVICRFFFFDKRRSEVLQRHIILKFWFLVLLYLHPWRLMAHVRFHFQAPECSLIYSHYNSISTFQFLSQIPYGALCSPQVMYILSECLYQSSAFIGYQALFIQGKSTRSLLLQQCFGLHNHKLCVPTYCCSLNFLLKVLKLWSMKECKDEAEPHILIDSFIWLTADFDRGDLKATGHSATCGYALMFG